MSWGDYVVYTYKEHSIIAGKSCENRNRPDEEVGENPDGSFEAPRENE